MTKAALKTVQGGNQVRMRVTSTGFGMRYVLKISHSAEIPLLISQGPKTGAGHGSTELPPGKTYRYEFGSLDHKPHIIQQIEDFSFSFPDGRPVDSYHDVPCWINFGLGGFGHKRKVAIQ